MKKNAIYVRIIRKLTFTIFSFCLLFATANFFPISSSEQRAKAVGEVQSSSLTLVVENDVASADLKPLDINGTFVESSDISFSVTTDHYSGYKLFVSAEDDDGFLSSGEYNISSISSNLTESQFNTAQYNNMWGLGYNGFYLQSPTIAGTIIDETAEANTTANNYSLSFAVRADYGIPAGNYSKNLSIITVGNPTPYVITYIKNTTDEVSNMPTTQSGETTATSIILSSKEPIRDGYRFLGWCPNHDERRDFCEHTLLEAGATWGVDQTDITTVDLYAFWEKLTMQNYTLEDCRNYAASSPDYLVDERDEKEYSVRYVNGGCYMTRNLSFELSSGMVLNAYTTNLRGLTATTGEITTTLASMSDLTYGNSYTEARVHYPTETDLGKTKLTAAETGYWYNYCAATAGQICSGSSLKEATMDICPANWKIPSNAEWGLFGGYGAWSDTFIGVFSPVMTGVWNQGYLNGASTRGDWWSTTAYNEKYRYRLYYFDYYGSGASLISNFYDDRQYGAPVRCILSR